MTKSARVYECKLFFCKMQMPQKWPFAFDGLGFGVFSVNCQTPPLIYIYMYYYVFILFIYVLLFFLSMAIYSCGNFHIKNCDVPIFSDTSHSLSWSTSPFLHTGPAPAGRQIWTTTPCHHLGRVDSQRSGKLCFFRT